jgi:predicted nucleic acid-binding protein
MKQMKGKAFVDSNVLLYLLSNDERKKNIVKVILNERPAISTQVISENINVAFKKFKTLSSSQITEHTHLLSTYCYVSSITVATIEKALELKARYSFQWYDCTILSAALLENCTVIYSEDMQHDQLINGNLRIVNPFL